VSPLGRPRRRWKDDDNDNDNNNNNNNNDKINLKEIGCEHGLDSSGSAYGPMGGLLCVQQ
jgi:hypothetical protein